MPWICESKNENRFSSQTPGQERNDKKTLISTKDNLETMQQESEIKNKRSTREKTLNISYSRN